MLSENLQELLSAYVDGELSPAEYERVMSALRDSESARAYVQQLRSMSSQLKTLPELPSPVNFSKRFFEQHQETNRRVFRRRWMAAAAMAASLLLGVSLWLMTGKGGTTANSNPNNVEIAKITPEQPNHNSVNHPAIGTNKVEPAHDWSRWVALGQQSGQVLLREWNVLLQSGEQSLDWLAAAVVARETRAMESAATLLSSPVKLANNPFKTLDVRLPVLVAPSEFSVAALEQRWSKKGLFVLDINSDDSVITTSRLLDAAVKQGVRLAVDEEVKQRLAKKLPAVFMVYWENVDEAKLRGTLQELAKQDHWRDALNASLQSTQSILFYPLDGDGKKNLARGLGVREERLQAINNTSNRTTNEFPAVALSYFPTRVASTIGAEVQKVLAESPGPRANGVSIVVMVRMGR